MEEDLVLEEIEKQHLLANEALKNKELTTYLLLFSEELQYKQLNGNTIDKKQLTEDTKKYFTRIRKVSNSYDRLEYSINGSLFTERLIQKSQVGIRVFVFFTKNWKLEREGIYTWEKTNGEWRIIKVKIVNENVV